MTPTHVPLASERVQMSAGTATITTSQPSCGPCVPLRVTGPFFVHVQNTPTTAIAIAIGGTTCNQERPVARRMTSSSNEPRR